MLSSYLVLRFVKLLAVAAFFAGVTGTFSAREPAARRRWAELHAAPGYVVTWVVGLGMAMQTGRSVMEGWIAGAFLASTVCVWLVLAQAHLLAGKSRALSGIASLSFLTALALMVFKP